MRNNEIDDKEIEQLDEQLDELDDEIDQGQELSDAQLEQYGLAPQKEQSNLYNWFWKVVQLKDESLEVVKVGNLFGTEIGEHGFSVRECLNLATLGSIFGHPTFGKYFENKAKIIVSTSMARRGWFMDLSISQRKIRARQKDSSSAPKIWKGRGIFNKNKGGTPPQPRQ